MVVPASIEAARILPLDGIRMSEKESKVPDGALVSIVPQLFRQGKITMKLFFLFFIMDALTLLAYPIVFVYGKLRGFSTPKESTSLAS
jgi:hypothetical protein